MTDRGEVIDAATVTLVNAFTASVVARVRSDANGMFVLETADAGQYIAMATKPDHEVGTESVIFARDDGAGTTLQFRLRKRGACDPG
jgi:hypothetical protein